MYSRCLSKYAFSSLRLPSVSHTPQPFTGNAEEILTKRNAHFSKMYPLSYKNPLLITQGYLQYLFDHKGNRYLDLDANGNIVNLGHCHPAIKEIIQREAGKLVHTSTIYMSENQGLLSKKILEELGQGFDSVYLCNSSGEATDFALFIARGYAGENTVYSYRNSYHGLVGNGRTVTSIGSWNSPFIDKFDAEKLAWPKQSDSLDTSIESLKDVLATVPSGRPGVLIYEGIQGKSGVHIAPAGYLKEVNKIFQQHKALTICDESTTGLGRLGKQQWAFKWQGHIPDIVIIGAGLANGNAIAAVVTRKDLALKHNWFNTFAAGHLQTRIAVETLNIIKRQKLSENADKVGKYLLGELQRIAKKHETILQIRGKGLLIGIDVLENGKPSQAKAQALMEAARERQLLFGRGGIHGNVLLITPPLCFSLEDAKYTVQALDDALHHIK